MVGDFMWRLTLLIVLSMSHLLYAQSYQSIVLDPQAVKYEFKSLETEKGLVSMVYFYHQDEFLIAGQQGNIEVENLIKHILSADSHNQKVRLLVLNKEERNKKIIYSGIFGINNNHIFDKKNKAIEELREAQKEIENRSIAN
jgi:hypothetical protein